LLEKCSGQRWILGRRPELYAVLAQPNPQGLSPMEARYSEVSTWPLAHSWSSRHRLPAASNQKLNAGGY
jgi:hypothetical protein